ncbi:unnamed protein product, partial [Rotaria magnacalcarata]
TTKKYARQYFLAVCRLGAGWKGLNDIYEQISEDMFTLEHDLLIYLNLSTNTAAIEEDYVYFQFLTELILDRNEISNGLQELIHFSRQEYNDNDEELIIINDFEKNHQSTKAID